MTNRQGYINSQFQELEEIFGVIKKLTPKICEIVDICVKAIKNGNKIIFCGNGGSASQSQHLCAELVGRYKLEREPMNSISLTVDTSNLTAIGNDYGFENIFSRQLKGVGIKGDVIIGLSTSGNSKNVLNAFDVAKEKGITTVALLGRDGGEMSKVADYSLIVPAKTSAHIQECHLAIGHLICDLIEKEIYGNN